MGLTRPRAHQLQDIDYKQTSRAITTTNITLSGGAPATVDGVSLALNDRVLVTGQSTGSENGIYSVTTVGAGSNGTWARSSDADGAGELNAGSITMVTEGTTYADTQWKLTTDDPITIGSTALTFVRNGAAAYGVFAVEGQSSIVADAVGDTLTIVAGTNIALTTNDGTDTLTITPSLTPAFTSLTAAGLAYPTADGTSGQAIITDASGNLSFGDVSGGGTGRVTFNYAITGTPTTVTGADSNGDTLAYTAGQLDVFVNGVRMAPADITATNGTSVVFGSALANSDVVDIVTYTAFDVVTNNADDLSSGTVPDARFPATLPAISGVNLTNLDATDLTGTIASARIAGAYTGITSVGTLTGFTSTGIDDNATSTAITIDSSGRMLLGTTTEGNVGADDLTIATTGNTGITIRSGTTHNGGIYFSDGTSGADEYRGYVDYDHNGNNLNFATDAVERMRINSSGNAGLGVVPNSSWNSSWTALQLGATGFVGQFQSGATDVTALGTNVWSDGAYKYIETDEAAMIKLQNGTMIFDVAPSGTADSAISFTTAMTIANSGKVGLGIDPSTLPSFISHAMKIANGGGLSITSPASGDNRLIFFGTGTSSADVQLAAIKNTGSDLMFLGAAGSEKMRIDSSGNVGIGTTSPVSKLTVAGQITATGGAVSAPTYSFDNDTNTGISRPTTDAVNIVTAGSERMRIDSSGKVYIGTTTNVNAGAMIVQQAGNGTGITVNGVNNTSGAVFMYFTEAGANCGYIQRVGTTSAVTYATSSDYRLKENVTPMTGALAKVSLLKPVTFDWKAGGSSQGFIAHELQEVIPDAVTGVKDQVNENGSINSQGVDTSYVVATLTSAMQEQQALIEALTARITALENGE